MAPPPGASLLTSSFLQDHSLFLCVIHTSSTFPLLLESYYLFIYFYRCDPRLVFQGHLCLTCSKSRSGRTCWKSDQFLVLNVAATTFLDHPAAKEVGGGGSPGQGPGLTETQVPPRTLGPLLAVTPAPEFMGCYRVAQIIFVPHLPKTATPLGYSDTEGTLNPNSRFSLESSQSPEDILQSCRHESQTFKAGGVCV